MPRWLLQVFAQCHLLSDSLSSVQLLTCVQLFATPWTAARQASLSFTNSWSLPKLMSIKSVMPINHIILCHPLLLLPSIFPSIMGFSELVIHIRWPNYWSFSISPFSEYSVLISFRIEQQSNIKYQNLLNIANMEHRGKIILLNAFMKEYSSGKE